MNPFFGVEGDTFKERMQN